MRKLTQRLTSRTNSYSGHGWQFIWLIALLIFVQQMGHGQDEITGRDTTVCAGTTVDLSTLITYDTAAIAGKVDSHFYNTTSESTAYTFSNFNVAPTTTTTYFLHIDTVGASTRVDTAMVTINVNALPTYMFALAASGDSICQGQHAEFIITSVANNRLHYVLNGASVSLTTTSGPDTIRKSSAQSSVSFKIDSIVNITTGCINTLVTDTMVIVSPTPIKPVITASESTCEGHEVIFTITGTANTVVNYDLDGTAGFDTLKNGTLSLKKEAVITGVDTIVTLSISSANLNGCPALLPIADTVYINKKATPQAGSDVSLCFDALPYELVGTNVSGGSTNGVWSVLKQESGSTTSLNLTTSTTRPDSVKFTTNKAGVYELLLTTADPDGTGPCIAYKDTVKITVDPIAIVYAGADKELFLDEQDVMPYQLVGSSFGGAASTAAWSVASFPNTAILGQIKFSTIAQTNNPSVQTFEVPNDPSYMGEYELVLTTDNPSKMCGAVTDTVVLTIKSKTLMALNNPPTVICNPYSSDVNFEVDFKVDGGSGYYLIIDKTNPGDTDTLAIVNNGLASSSSVKQNIILKGPHKNNLLMDVVVRDTMASPFLETSFTLTIPDCSLDSLVISNVMPGGLFTNAELQALDPMNPPMIHDPCSCNNDQSENGAQDGSFNETVTVLDKSMSDTTTWRVIDFGKLKQDGGPVPSGVTKGLDTLMRLNDTIYFISFQHYDDAGYFIQVTNGTDTLMDSNICQYPEITNFPLNTASYDISINISPVQFASGFSYSPASSADTNFVFNGLSNQAEFDPNDLAVGKYTARANLLVDSTGNASKDTLNPANPGCFTYLNANFQITDSRINSTPDYCVCSGDDKLKFIDTIRLNTVNASDTIYFVNYEVLNPGPVFQSINIFKNTTQIKSTKWREGIDTLSGTGTGTVREFVGFRKGNVDALITFARSSGDTIRIALYACDKSSELMILGTDNICEGQMASFSLNQMVDSVSWEFGNFAPSNNATYTIPNVDSSGLISVRASGSYNGTCVDFDVSKNVYVQDTSFEINGNQYACLDDTLTYSLDLKGATPNYSTPNGVQWKVINGGRIIGDSINVTEIQVMWDSLVKPHVVMVTGMTTIGCAINELITVNVDSTLSGHIKGPQTACLGGTQGFKSVLDKIDVLEWSIIPDSAGTVTKVSKDSVLIQWNEVGIHEIKVSGTADNGACIITDSTFMVEVKDTSFLLSGFDASCQGDSTYFSIRNADNSLVDAADLRWYIISHVAPTDTIYAKDTFSIAMNGVMDSIKVVWDSVGDHTVYVTGSTIDGCEISESKLVNVRDMNFTIFGDTIICAEDTVLYKIYDANHKSVTNMQTIDWFIRDNSYPMPIQDMYADGDSLGISIDLAGDYSIIVSGTTEDGCAVNDTLDIMVVDRNDLKIVGPQKLLGFRDTMWTLNTPDSLLNNVQWKVINANGFPTIAQISGDTFRMSKYAFFGGSVYDSMNIVVTGNVGTMCTFTDTIPLIIRDSTFQIFGDPIVCNLSDSSIYHVNVPGIKSIAWSVDGMGNTIVDTIGTDKDSIAIVWNSNGKITATIMTTDGWMIVDDLVVFVRENSVILGDTSVSELDTVAYTLKGLTATDTLDFTDLTSITWTFPSNGAGLITNARMDSIQVVYANQNGDPFYRDSISVSFMTNDGCIDTIKQYIQIRESSYGLMGMTEICQDGEFNFTFGSFTGTGDLIDLPTSVINDIAYATWTLPDGGSVVSSAGDSATLKFNMTGQHRIMVTGAFKDSCKFEFIDSINLRSKHLELTGDLDGFVFDGQTTQFDIMEVDKGVSTKLAISDYDGIIWAVSQYGDIQGSNSALNSVGLLANISSTAVAATPLSGTAASITSRLQTEALDSFLSITNGESKGMANDVSVTFHTAGTSDKLFVSLVTTAGCVHTETVDVAINNNSNTGSIACNNLVNVSMGPDCIFDVGPDLILEDVGDAELNEYSVRITDQQGNFISNGRLDQGEVGKTLIVTVTHDGSENNCWGTIFVEDKNIPDLLCGLDTIGCDDDFSNPNATFWDFEAAAPRYRGFPIPASARAFPVSGQMNTYALINFDFCGADTLRYSDDDDPLSCADGMSRRVLRTWSITSRSGFTPIVCVDTIFIEKLDIDSIDFRVFLPHRTYRCDQKSTILLDGYPNPDITGNLDDLKDDLCYQLNAGYTDTKAELCGEGIKYFRHWTVIDWCTAEDTTILQIISFEDKEDPAISRPVVFDNISDDHECTNVFSIRRPTFTDCSEIIKVILELRKIGDPTWTMKGEKTTTDEDFIGISFGMEGDQVEARYILTDACGNMGTSAPSVRINIQDNITPVAVCDEEVVITLNDEGVAFATYRTFDDGSSDNCGIVKFEIRRLSTECDHLESLLWGPLVGFCCFDLGRDDILVELRVTDEAGNMNTCASKISVQELATKIKAENVPPDVTVSCGADLSDLVASYGKPLFLASVCGQKIEPTEIVISVLDDCGKGVVTRTWTAINSFGATLPIEIGPGTSVLSVQQVITVGTQDDVLSADDIVWPKDIDTIGCLSSLDPRIHTYLGFPIFENAPCSDPIATYDDQIFKNVEGYCAKVVRTWKVIDWCTVDSLDRNNPNGLFFEHVQILKLQDNTDPEITSGGDNQTLDANTSDCKGFYTFTASGMDDCETEFLKWVYELDIDNDGTIDATGKTNAFDITLPEGTHKIDWTLSDGCDNIDQASQLITIDATGCDVNTGGSFTISGKLFTEDNYTVDNVNVTLTNAVGSTLSQQMTPINGQYAFSEIAANGTYKVKPIKNDDYGNGVSTADMVLIQNHILGFKTFDSPYKVIAADVNGSSTVSAADVILIGRLVIGIDNEFPIKRSWSFVDANAQFDNILSPFPYVDIISMYDLNHSNVGMDFVAVKMGDVNGNVSLASITQSRSNKTRQLIMENETIEANKMFSIPFKTEESIDLAGLQMGLSFDKEKVEFLGVYGNGFEVSAQNINEKLLKNGEIVMSWSETGGPKIEAGETLFELRFASKAPIHTTDVVEMNMTFIQSEMYRFDDNQLETIAFTIETAEASNIGNGLTLFQNTPNPFQSSTDIRFSIPDDSYVQLDIFDLSGKTVYHHEQKYNAGINKVRISSDILAEGGLYIYQVADGNQIVQKKMIYIK